MTLVDWIAIAIVVLAAIAGLQRGLVLSAFSLAGLAGGAYAGSRVAPLFLSGGSNSIWTPVVGLVGAILGATVLQVAALLAGSAIRGGLRLTPLRFVDTAGGLVLGVVTGLLVVEVGAAVARQLPGQGRLRQDVQRSWIVRKVDAALPPSTLLNLLARIDPFPSITGPAAPTLPPSTGILRNHAIHSALSRVVKVLGTACGYGVEGSGWVAGPGIVVTAAHVVAGEHDTIVQIPGDPASHAAQVIFFDARNDVAVLRLRDVRLQSLPFADPRDGASVVIAGYPQNGNLTVVPGRVGRTATVVSQDAYGRGPVTRTITAVAGQVEHGDSGGPLIDRNGEVEGEIFAAQKGAAAGYAVPSSLVRDDIARAGGAAVSTGGCAP